MLSSYADFLRLIPLDATLKTYLADCGFTVSAGFNWKQIGLFGHEALIGEIESYSDKDVRSCVIAGFQVAAQLATSAGKSAMQHAALEDASAIARLALCEGDEHRALLLMVHYPNLFQAASDAIFVDSKVSQALSFDLRVKNIPVNRDEASLDDFCLAIGKFYQKELNCGDAVTAHMMDRSSGTQLITIHAKDHAKTELKFIGDVLERGVDHPTIHMALEYSQLSGVARTLIKGGEKYHKMLASAFVEHMLNKVPDVIQIKPQQLDLSALRAGFNAPQAHKDGFSVVQLKSLTVLAPDKSLKAVFTATKASQRESVSTLLAKKLPTENPLHHMWTVESALINLYYPPIKGKRAKMVTVEVTSKGRLNLNKYDNELRTQLEGYLIEAGILKPTQTLEIHEVKDPCENPELGSWEMEWNT